MRHAEGVPIRFAIRGEGNAVACGTVGAFQIEPRPRDRFADLRSGRQDGLDERGNLLGIGESAVTDDGCGSDG